MCFCMPFTLSCSNNGFSILFSNFAGWAVCEALGGVMISFSVIDKVTLILAKSFACVGIGFDVENTPSVMNCFVSESASTFG